MSDWAWVCALIGLVLGGFGVILALYIKESIRDWKIRRSLRRRVPYQPTKGGIKTNYIDDNAITATRIEIGSITANELDSSSIVADKLSSRQRPWWKRWRKR